MSRKNLTNRGKYMCGICGCIVNNSIINKERFEYMIDIVEHRGPDDRGVYYEKNVALGHRRLAVIDLSKEGHQPFCYHNRYILVYNGEIYNYLELKDELLQRGYRFSSKTDTEILAATYDCFGEECVNKFNGMWSFAIYDKIKSKIFCSRDRFGIKPFYYYVDKSNFLFASEIKQILSMKDGKPQANKQKLLEFLVCGVIDGTEDTMFQGVRQLLGGYNLVIDTKTMQFKTMQYYNLEKEKTSKNGYSLACKKFRNKFHNAVNIRLRADVPVGYCLSGGLDSSSIVCMADKIRKEQGAVIEQHSVSSCFEDKRYDEQEYIDEVVKHTDIISHKTFPSQKELFEKIDRIIWHMDEPFGSTSIYAQWCVFEEAKRNKLKVMLDGQGADEQLAGYGGYFVVLLTYYLKKFRFISFFREARKYVEINSTGNKRKFFESRIKRAIRRTYVPNRLYKRSMKKNGYNDLPFTQDVKEQVYKGRNINLVKNEKKFILDSMRYGLAELLHYEDRNSMAHSIESRVPFLDYNLVELIFSMPFVYKIRNGITKAVLRDGLNGILPEKIRTRYTKLGFVTPEDQWINNNFDLFGKELEEACEGLKEIIDKKLIMDWFGKQQGKIKKADFLPWRIICAGRWIKVFDVTFEEMKKQD